MTLLAIEGATNVRKLRSQGQRWPQGQTVPSDWIEEGHRDRARFGMPRINLNLEAEKFVDFWVSKSGQGATKLDWRATWRNWCRNARGVAEADPEKKVAAQDTKAFERVALALKGITVGTLQRQDIRASLDAGKITAEQAKSLGY